MDVLHQNLEQHKKNEFEKFEKQNPGLAGEMDEVLEYEPFGNANQFLLLQKPYCL